MTDLIQKLRASADPLAGEILEHIQNLEERVRHQHVTLDKAASIMLEATVSEDGIDGEQADACIDQIRGLFTEIGKTTVEHYQGLIYAKVGQIAGIAPDDEFDIMAELEKMGAAVEAGKKNVAYAEWAMSVLWRDSDKPRMTTSTGCGCCGDDESFPEGTTWQQAIDAILAEQAAIVPAPPAVVEA